MKKYIVLLLLAFCVGAAMPVSIQDTSNLQYLSIDEVGRANVVLGGHVDTMNSTSTALGIDEVYTGTAINIEEESGIIISVYADKASATDGLSVEFSTDSINFDNTDEYTIPKNKGKTYSFQPAAKYYRIVYTNGDTAQTQFRLQSLLKHTGFKPSSHRIQDHIADEDDAELVKAVLSAKNDLDTFVNVGATASGNLRVTDAESGLAIAKGDVSNTTFIHKFGNAHDFDTGDDYVTIWDGADDANVNAMLYTYSTTADINRISSSSGSDVQKIEVRGLNSDSLLIIDTVTLQGQTKTTLDSTFLRVHRMTNVNTSDNVGHIYLYVDGTITSGVPDDPTDVRAVIQPTNNQTLMAVFTVPKDKTGYMRDWYSSTSGANRSSNYIVELRARPAGGVFQVKHVSSISDDGTSAYKHEYIEPEVFGSFTDIEMRVKITAAGVTAASVSGGFDIVLVDN